MTRAELRERIETAADLALARPSGARRILEALDAIPADSLAEALGLCAAITAQGEEVDLSDIVHHSYAHLVDVVIVRKEPTP